MELVIAQFHQYAQELLVTYYAFIPDGRAKPTKADGGLVKKTGGAKA